MRATVALFVAGLAALPSWAQATITPYSSQVAFQAALDISYTWIDFDATSFSKTGGVVPSDARFTPFGLDVIQGDPRGFTNFLVTSTNYPANIGGPAWAMFNGSGTSNSADDFAVNFLNPVSGFGMAPNRIDGGVIAFYSGPDLTGSLLGTVANTGSGAFVGGISDVPFQSAQITCEFDGDYTCGVTDLQFGLDSQAQAAVPLPTVLPAAAGLLLGAGIWARRRTG